MNNIFQPVHIWTMLTGIVDAAKVSVAPLSFGKRCSATGKRATQSAVPCCIGQITKGGLDRRVRGQ